MANGTGKLYTLALILQNTLAHQRPTKCPEIKKLSRPLWKPTAKSFQSCPTLCDPTDSSPPGSPVPGIFPARTLEWVAISFSLKYKNTVSQKTSYRDTELQIQVGKYLRSSKIFKGRKGSQVERRGRRWERGAKGWSYRRLLPPADTQALWDFTLGLQRREDWNSALPEIRTRIRVLCQEEVISLQSSAQAEALRPDSCVQDRGTRKTGKDRKD